MARSAACRAPTRVAAVALAALVAGACTTFPPPPSSVTPVAAAPPAANELPAVDVRPSTVTDEIPTARSLIGAPNDALARAEVSLVGSEGIEVSGAAKQALHFVIAIDGLRDVPLDVATMRLAARTERVEMNDLAPARVTGPRTIPARGRVRIDAWFATPEPLEWVSLTILVRAGAETGLEDFRFTRVADAPGFVVDPHVR